MLVVVRLYCSSKDVEHGLNFKFVEDNILIVATSLELTLLCVKYKSTSVKGIN